jgi:hypothetical protein
VSIKTFSKVMSTALEQTDDSPPRMRVDNRLARDLPALAGRFHDFLRGLLAGDHGELNFLLILQANFFERLEDSVLVQSVKGAWHE